MSNHDSYDDENYEAIENEENAERNELKNPKVATMTPMLVQTEDVDDYPHKPVEMRFERYLHNRQHPNKLICEECGMGLGLNGDMTKCMFCGADFIPIKERSGK